MTIIFFTGLLPNPIADELMRQGHDLFESLSISETFALQEEHPHAHIVIAAKVEEQRATVIQQRYPTLMLKPEATAKDVLWELSHFSSTGSLQ